MSTSKRILVVEDEIVLQDVYKLILETGGYEVHVADNGQAGLQKIKTFRPDLVLLDIFMPIMDGKEMLRNVDMSQYPNMQVIVYSNMYDHETEAEMLSLGASDFVLKSSFTPNDLLELVAARLN